METNENRIVNLNCSKSNASNTHFNTLFHWLKAAWVTPNIYVTDVIWWDHMWIFLTSRMKFFINV